MKLSQSLAKLSQSMHIAEKSIHTSTFKNTSRNGATFFYCSKPTNLSVVLTKDDKSNARTRCPTMHCGLAIIQGRTKQLALWQQSCQELATRDLEESSRLLTPLTFLIRPTHPCLWAIVNIQMTCGASFVQKYLLTEYYLDCLYV